MNLLADWVNKHPGLYEALQNAANFSRCIPGELLRLLRGEPCDGILEIGCGTAEIAKLLGSEVPYVGIDRNERFVEFARARRPGRFFCADVTRSMPDVGRFHTGMFLGVLHHFDDGEALSMWDRVRPFVERRVVVMEPIKPAVPDFRYAIYAALERGRFVRTADEWEALFSRMGLSVVSRSLITMANPISRKIVCGLRYA